MKTKIGINSKIYAPDLMLAITITGQFYLLSVIEALVEIGVKIISANTDGVTFGGTPALVAEPIQQVRCAQRTAARLPALRNRLHQHGVRQ